MERESLVLTEHFAVEGFHTLGVYRARGGYEAARKALHSLTPAEVTEEVKKSGLRGRGGAGFPTGMKWGFIRKGEAPVFLCVNADESEPGTFKDRHLLEKAPHLVVEGALIAAYAIGANDVYIYIRGEYKPYAARLAAALQEARDAGLTGKKAMGSGADITFHLRRGAGAYICGEETALLESLEGKRGNPRLKPPFPANVGLYGGPTIINNVETLANVPVILRKGADWFASLGTPKNGGTRLFGVSGHVERPGLYERPMGYPLRRLIEEDAGGILGGGRLKAVIPGGSSTPVLRAEECDIGLDFDQVAAAGSMLGSAGVIVFREGTCMVSALHRLAHFYHDESCGQCSPCREGTGWMKRILDRLVAGRGRPVDPDLLLDVAGNISGNTICPLGDAAAMPVISFVTKFRAEFDALAAPPAAPTGVPAS